MPEDKPGTNTPVVSNEDKTFIAVSHAAGIVGPIGPLVVWLLKKDQSAVVGTHAKAALNFQISMMIYGIGASVVSSILWFVGWLIMPIFWIAWLVLTITGTVKASNGELYRYPLAINIIK